jgi:hypothetical protein
MAGYSSTRATGLVLAERTKVQKHCILNLQCYLSFSQHFSENWHNILNKIAAMTKLFEKIDKAKI